MTERTSRTRPPLTLIANSQEWHSRSLESILSPHGYAVLRAVDRARELGSQAFRQKEPFACIDFTPIMSDTDGVELAQAAANDILGTLTQVLRDTGIRMAAGFDAVANYHDAPIEPSDMLMRASMAMRLSRSSLTAHGPLNIRKFEGQLN